MSFLFKSSPGDTSTTFSTIRLTSAVLGIPLPILFGQRRVAGKLLWYGNFLSSTAPQAGGSALNSKAQQQDVYYASVVIGLCQGICGALKQVWSGQDVFGTFANQANYQVPLGGGSFTPQFPPPQTAARFDEGLFIGNQPYSITVNDFGSGGAKTISGTQSIPLVAGVDYTYDTGSGTYTFPPTSIAVGQLVTISFVFFFDQFISTELAVIPPLGTVVPEHQNVFFGDEGVSYYPSGIALQPVSSVPTAPGTYYPGPPVVGAAGTLGNVNSGKYQFYTGNTLNQFGTRDVGEAIEIKYQWVQPTQSGAAPTYLNLTFFHGSPGQTPWSYLSTNNPGYDLGYTEVSYVGSSTLYLGYQPTMPNYNYEVYGLYPFGGGIVDANPAPCIAAITSDPTFGVGLPSEFIDPSLMGVASNWWVAYGFFISPLIENHKTAASVIGEICEASQVGNWWSEGVWKFAPYGDTSAVGNGATFIAPQNTVVSLNDADFISDGPQDDPVKVKEIPWPNRYNKCGVRWSVRTNNYNDDVLYGQDDGSIMMFGLRQETPVSYDFICTESVAQIAANLRVQRYSSVTHQYEFKLKTIYPYLEPMDVIEISDTRLGLVNTPVRIISIDDDPSEPFSVIAEDYPWSIATAVLYPKQTQLVVLSQDTNQDPGNTDLVVFEVPGAITGQQGNTVYVFVNGKNSSWGGCQIYMSFDQQVWNVVDNTIKSGRFGVLAEDFPVGSDPDTVDTLVVTMENSEATLTSVSRAAVDSFTTLSALLNPGNGALTFFQESPTICFDAVGAGSAWNNPSNLFSATDYADVSITGGGLYSVYSRYPAIVLDAGVSPNTPPGVNHWTNPSNAEGAPDGNSAICTLDGTTGNTTNTLTSALYDFALFPIPATDTIVGVVVTPIGHGSRVRTGTLYIQLLGSIGLGSPLIGVPTMIPISFPFFLGSGGSSTYLWGTTLTSPLMNATDFGVAIWGVNTDGIFPWSVSVDAIQVTVYTRGASSVFGTSVASNNVIAAAFDFNLLSGSPATFGNILGFQVDFEAEISQAITDGGSAAIGVQFCIPQQSHIGGATAIPLGSPRITQVENVLGGSPLGDNWEHYTLSGPFEQAVDWGTNIPSTQVNDYGLSIFAVLTNTAQTVDFRVSDVRLTVYVEAETALELIAYEDAALTGLDEYGLTYIRRGLFGTSIEDWPAGSFFARLDQANYTYQYPNSMIGKIIYLKATSYNQFGNRLQGLEAVETVIVPLQGFTGAFDLLSGSIQTGAGATVPSWSGSITYTSTATTITWTWSFTLLRNNGQTQLFQGSQLIIGLTLGTVYYFYPYVDDSNGTENAIVTMVSGVNGVGSPSWAQVFASQAAAQIASSGTHLPLSDAILAAATTATGSGGGFNGGRNSFFG